MKDKSPVKDSPNIYFVQLVGEIDAPRVRETIEELSIANAKNYVDEVQLTLVTYGGDLLYSFALYDHIEHFSKPVNIIAEGVCMSAGVMILQAAQKRLSTPNTLFMVHPSITHVEEKAYHEFLSIVDQYKKNHELFVKLSIQRSGISTEEFEKVCTPRKYLSAADALKFGKHGLIDEIVKAKAA